MEVNFFMIKIEIPNSIDRIRQTLNLVQGKVQDLVRDDKAPDPSCHAEFISASHSNLEIN